MSTPKFKNQNVYNVRCNNSECKYWVHSHRSGLCKEVNPRIDIHGTCITMELEIWHQKRYSLSRIRQHKNRGGCYERIW